jgi:hypothetical protein
MLQRSSVRRASLKNDEMDRSTMHRQIPWTMTPIGRRSRNTGKKAYCNSVTGIRSINQTQKTVRTKAVFTKTLFMAHAPKYRIDHRPERL